MIQKQFAERVVTIVKNDPNVLGLAAGGSWISNEMDEFSDLDLILVTLERTSSDKEKMLAYAGKFGNLLSGFTGEHVGEPRVLICLYDDPLLHVDIKFITLPEFRTRVEDPVILFEREGRLTDVIKSTNSQWPYPDFQWIEDRFWTWIHYTALKIGRGEYLETLDGLGFLRTTVLSPLLQIRTGKLPRGLRKVESTLPATDMGKLKSTIAVYDLFSLFNALENAIIIYKELRQALFGSDVKLQSRAEQRSLEYLQEIKSKKLSK